MHCDTPARGGRAWQPAVSICGGSRTGEAAGGRYGNRPAVSRSGDTAPLFILVGEFADTCPRRSPPVVRTAGGARLGAARLSQAPDAAILAPVSATGLGEGSSLLPDCRPDDRVRLFPVAVLSGASRRGDPCRAEPLARRHTGGDRIRAVDCRRQICLAAHS